MWSESVWSLKQQYKFIAVDCIVFDPLNNRNVSVMQNVHTPAPSSCGFH